jgi:hypothetical protein
MDEDYNRAIQRSPSRASDDASLRADAEQTGGSGNIIALPDQATDTVPY